MYIHVYPMNLPFSLCFIERVYARANCSPSTPTPWLRTSGAGVDLPNTGGISMEFRWIFCGFQLQMGIASETNQLLIWHHRDHHWFNQLSNQPLLPWNGETFLEPWLWPQTILLWGSCSLATSGSRSYINLDQFWPAWAKRHGWERNPPRKLLGFVGETWWNTLSFLSFLSRKPSRQLQSPNPPFMNKSALSLRRWPGSMERPAFSQCWICILVASRDAKEGNSGCNLFLTGKKKTCSSGMFRILNGGSFKFGPAICSHSVMANSLVQWGIANRNSQSWALGQLPHVFRNLQEKGNKNTDTWVWLMWDTHQKNCYLMESMMI